MSNSTRSWMLRGLMAWTAALPILAWGAVAPGAANASHSAPVLEAAMRTEHVALSMISERSLIAPGERLSILVHQRIIPGWHTYWINPGDSGQAPQIKWRLPPGTSAGPIQWPVPMRIHVGPLVNYGYADDVALISDLVVPGNWPAGTPFPVQADISWLVCADVCIPESGSFSLSIPTGSSATGTSTVYAAAQPLFAAARASQPVASPWRTRIDAHDGMVVLHVSLPKSEASRIIAAEFFPAEWGIIDHSATQQFSWTGDSLSITAPKGDLPTPTAASGIVTLTEAAGGTPLHKAISFSTAAASVPQPGTGATATSATATAATATGTTAGARALALVAILLPALLGGVLLNLMPCVFPVLAMKALALVGHAQESPRKRIAGGIAYTAGVLVSFAILGAVLLALKAGGNTVGWGFQLQSPAFVALLAYILFLSGLALSGLFEVGGRLMGAGSALAARWSGAPGSFFTGALATTVATPCTAPFMATALGAALTQSGRIAMATFLVLGLGLALPYLALSLVPGLARRLPRPGHWMSTLKQLLAFPLYLSAAWLVWVLAQQSGADGVLGVLLGMVAIAFAVWLWRLEVRGRIARAARGAACVAVALGSLALAVTAAPLPARTAATVATNEVSEPFTRARLDDLRTRGQPVFVNLTAAWCITCKVNERVALSGTGFRAALKAGGFAYLKGDWTRGDPEITRLLQSFGRQGVPLYVVFPARGGTAVVLPQVLTESTVVEALRASAQTSIAMSREERPCHSTLAPRGHDCS